MYAREASDWPLLFSSGEDWLSGMEFSFVTTKERLLKEISPELKKKKEGEKNMKGTKDKGKEGKGEMDVGYEFSKWKLHPAVCWATITHHVSQNFVIPTCVLSGTW